MECIHMYIVQSILLFFAGVADIRRKEIKIAYILGMSVVSIACIYMSEQRAVFDIVGGVSIGLCMIGLSLMTREQIGRGDGMVVAAVGAMLGIRSCVSVVCLASLLMAVVSIIILLLRKGNRNTRLPYIPALFAGYVIHMVCM